MHILWFQMKISSMVHSVNLWTYICTRNMDKSSWRLLWNLNHLVCAIFFVVNIRNVLIFKKTKWLLRKWQKYLKIEWDRSWNIENFERIPFRMVCIDQQAFRLQSYERFDGCQWQFFIKLEWNTIKSYLLTVSRIV